MAERPSIGWWYAAWMPPERRRTMAVTARVSRKRARRHDNKARRQAARAAIHRRQPERLNPHENPRHSIAWDLW